MKKNNQIPVLLGFLGILLLVLIFFVVYQPYIEKAEVLETENQELMVALNKYQEIADNEVYYKEASENYAENIRGIIAEYAYGLIREDQIMYMANLENRFSKDIRINYFNMGSDQEVLYASSSTEEVPTETPETVTTNSFQDPVVEDNGIRMYENTIEYGYDVSYEGIKDIVDYISEVGVKKNITSISLRFDSTSGLLAGTMYMSQYYLTGTDGTYVTTTIPSMKMGVENIFGTVDADLEDSDETQTDVEE